jgi:3'-phosphoadenosine 5'-phosphosulfate sulfotransferase (PAPS reductase)/FAD synthetase
VTQPALDTYDVLLVNSSAGKDSQAMLDYVVELADGYGIRDRVVVVHADLGRVEWKGTRELAEEHARHYGVRFEVVGRTLGDLLTHVEERGMWPGYSTRYCTADHKRAQVLKLITRLGREGATRILNCMGLRAEESTGRRKKKPFQPRSLGSTKRRTVDLWLPIQSWSLDEVWERNRQAGTRHHPAYDVGMPRLSCCFCIYAPKPALVLAGKHNPELLNEYVAVEQRIGHKFTLKVSMAEVKQAVDCGEPVGNIQSWSM